MFNNSDEYGPAERGGKIFRLNLSAAWRWLVRKKRRRTEATPERQRKQSYPGDPRPPTDYFDGHKS